MGSIPLVEVTRMSKDGANPSDVKKPEEQSSLLTKVIAFAPLLRLII
jgi:hypothetical protein